MTTPTTVARPFAHEAHAYDWLKAHNRPIIAAAVAAFVVVSVVRWYVNRVRGRRRFARARVSEPIAQALGNCPVTVKKSRLRDGSVTYMRLGYPAGARDHAGNNHIANLDAILEERMGGPVQIDWAKTRGIVTVQLARPAKAVETPAATLADRAQKVAHQLLGPESQVVNFVAQLNGKAQEFTVVHDSIHDAAPELRAKVDAYMQAKLGQQLQSQWDTARGRVKYRAVPELPTAVPHPANVVGDDHIIPFGIDRYSKVVAWDLNSEASHCLVCGMVGSGKTSALATIVTGATRRGIEVWAADYKRISLTGFRNWPGVARMALDVADIAALLIAAEDERLRRTEAVERGDLHEDDLTPIIIAVEECWATIGKLNDAWHDAGNKGEAPSVKALHEIIHLGRQTRLHVVAAFQRPDAKVMGGSSRDQFGCRILLGNAKRLTRQMMEFDIAIGAGEPRGRAVADVGGGAREVQVYWTPDPRRGAKLNAADRAILAALRPVAKPAPATPAPEPIAPLLPFVPRIVEAEQEPAAPTTKRCSKCQTDRDLAEFSADKQRPDGKRRWCRACDKARRTVAEKMPDDQRV